MRGKLKRRLDRMTPKKRSRGAIQRLGRFVPDRSRELLAQRLADAGSDADPIDVAGMKVFLGCVGLMFGASSSSGGRRVVVALILAAGGWRWPDFRLARRRETRRRQILETLPDTLDLLAASALAGASIGRALALASERDGSPLGRAFAEAVELLERGATRNHAYEAIAHRAGTPEVRAMMISLRRAEVLGTPVAETLGGLAREMRARRRASLEEDARGAPVKVLFPIVTCFLPAFILLTIAPVVVVALRGFRFR